MMGECVCKCPAWGGFPPDLILIPEAKMVQAPQVTSWLGGHNQLAVYHPLSHFWEDRVGFEPQDVGFEMDSVRDLLCWFLPLSHIFGISLSPSLALVLTFKGVSWNPAHCESSVCLYVHLATVGLFGGLTVQPGVSAHPSGINLGYLNHLPARSR